MFYNAHYITPHLNFAGALTQHVHLHVNFVFQFGDKDVEGLLPFTLVLRTLLRLQHHISLIGQYLISKLCIRGDITCFEIMRLTFMLYILPKVTKL